MNCRVPGVLATVAVLAGCGGRDQASQQTGAQQAPATTAPATTTTTTTTMPPPVWRTVRWGMTTNQVLAALPGEAQRLATPTAFGAPTPGSTDIAIPSYDVQGVPVRVLFGFESNGLNRIHLSAVKPGDASCGEVEKALTDKHGAPLARSNTGTSLRGEEIVWKRPDQTITLWCAGVASLGFRTVTVVYTPPS